VCQLLVLPAALCTGDRTHRRLALRSLPSLRLLLLLCSCWGHCAAAHTLTAAVVMFLTSFAFRKPLGIARRKVLLLPSACAGTPAPQRNAFASSLQARESADSPQA
jgi:hypothetical protein